MLELPHTFVAVTQTEAAPLKKVEDAFTIAEVLLPKTLSLVESVTYQLYPVAPVTTAMEYGFPVLDGQSDVAPVITPGTAGVLFRVSNFVGPDVEQALTPLAVKVADEKPVRVLTVTVVDTVSNVIKPLAKVTFDPVRVQRYRTAPVTVPHV